MDFFFSFFQNEFKQLFFMIFNVYIEGYEDVKVDGCFVFDGNVKGIFNVEKELFLVFKVNFEVVDVDVKYFDFLLGINGINIVVKINSLSSDLD